MGEQFKRGRFYHLLYDKGHVGPTRRILEGENTDASKILEAHESRVSAYLHIENKVHQ